jgi:hypothetical protein
MENEKYQMRNGKYSFRLRLIEKAGQASVLFYIDGSLQQ